jgi:hypothetical protein
MKTTLLVILMSVSGVAYGQARYHHQSASADNELSGNLGGQVGVDNAPGGGLMGVEYAHRLSERAWFDVNLDFSFGTSGCYYYTDRFGYVDCGPYYGNGSSLDLIAGVKWKFQTHNERLVPFAKVGGGLAFLFWPGPDNNGIAPVVRGGGGLKYFVLPQLGVGGEMNATFGPAFYSYNCAGCSTSDLYFAFNILASIEYDF